MSLRFLVLDITASVLTWVLDRSLSHSHFASSERLFCTLHTTSQYGQSFFPKTISAWNGLAFAEAPSLAVFRSNFIRN